MSTGSAPAARRPTAPDSASSTPGRRSFATRFVDLWWVTIPAKLRRYSLLLWATWSDGIYLTAWPRIATVLVFAVFLFGFAEGTTHWSYRTIVGTNGFAGNVLAPMATADNWGGPTHLVFADNLVLLMVAIAVGTISSNLGLMLVLGYALGDMLHGAAATGPGWRNTDPFNAWMYRHVPLLTSYVLFFFIAAVTVLVAMHLARSSHRSVPRSRLRMASLTALIQAVLICCWGALTPMVIRTVQLWSGGEPRLTVPFYTQVLATWLVPVAILAVFVRALIVKPALQQVSVLRRVQAAVARVSQTRVAVPKWARAILTAGIITLLIMGFLPTPDIFDRNPLSNFAEGNLIFVALTFALLVWSYWLPNVPIWQRWAEKIQRYPAVLRFAVAVLGTYVVCALLVVIPGLQATGPGEFGPEVTSILIGFAVTMVLLPHGWFGLASSTQGLRFRISATSQGAKLAIIASVVLASKNVFGDCNDYLCCFAGQVASAAASAAAAAVGATVAGTGLQSVADALAFGRAVAAHMPDPSDSGTGEGAGDDNSLSSTLGEKMAEDDGRIVGEAVGEVIGGIAGTPEEPGGGTLAGIVIGKQIGGVAGEATGDWLYHGGAQRLGQGVAGAVQDGW